MHNLYNVDWHATDRCNLRCASCGHFSCLLDKNDNSYDRTPQQAVEDFSELYRVTNDGEYLEHLTITGGECTLNKDLSEILKIAYNYFPNKITMYTNVINKDLYTDELMSTLQYLNISFECTLYYTKSEKILKELKELYPNIKYIDYGDKENTTFYNSFFTKDRIKHIDDGYCGSKFTCIQLKDKKIYPCQYCGYINIFFNKFGKYWKDILEFHEEQSFINLENINSYEELYQYLETFDYKNTFCKHCIDKWRLSLPKYGYEMNRTSHHITKENIREYIRENPEEILYETYCNNVISKKYTVGEIYDRLELI